jgi:sucrose-6-phosphate hydrolase SacC (GH32 family)
VNFEESDKEYRPKFHFTPANNWMNDPNGLVWHKGEYHLFFQHNPFGRDWGHMSWGHAVSIDLLHWEELSVAIPEGEDGAIFSGSAVSHGDEIIAIYTRNKDQLQTQCIATSTDNGRTFTKFEGNPVLDLGLEHFRDPKVFHYQDRWVMAVVKAQEHLVCLYSSTDLKEWTPLSEFGKVGATGGQWECPDFFPLSIDGNEVWVLIVSLSPGGIKNTSGTQYFIGDFDGTTFTPRYSTEEPRWLDYGSHNYAGVTFNNEPKNRRIFIGWLNSWQKQTHAETSWVGAMTIPRELGLLKVNNEIVLTQQPICDDLYEIKVKAPTSGVIGLQGFVKLGYNADKKTVFVDDYEAPYETIDGQLHLKIVIDSSSVELFTGDGTRSITLSVFPPIGASRELAPFIEP